MIGDDGELLVFREGGLGGVVDDWREWFVEHCMRAIELRSGSSPGTGYRQFGYCRKKTHKSNP